MVVNQLNIHLRSKLINYYSRYYRLFDYLFLFSGTILAVLSAALFPTSILFPKIIYLFAFIVLLLLLTFKWHIVRVFLEKSNRTSIIASIPITIWCGYKNTLNLTGLMELKKLIIILDTLSFFAILILINFVAIYIKIFFSDAGQKHRSWLISNYILILGVIAFFTYLPYKGNKTFDLPATLMTFSYSYGFIPRGLLGSLIHLLGKFLKTGVTSTLIDTFSTIGTFAFILSLILFFRYIINTTTNQLHDKSLYEETSINTILLVLFFSIGYGFSTFYLCMGYFDIYMIILTIACCKLIISNKSLWAIIPLTAICVLIHQGYVFMYFNIILVLLFYRTFKNIESKGLDKKSLVILILSATVCSVLFVYFQFFSHAKAGYTFDEIYLYTEQIIGSKLAHKNIILQELFSERFDRSISLSIYRKQLLVAIVLFSPYILILIRLWQRVISSVTSKVSKLVYLIMPFGIVTTLPLWIMHVDYGRWCYCVCFYEIAIILSLVAMKDRHFINAFNETAKSIQQKPILMFFLFLYIMSIGAFSVTYINPFLSTIIGWINNLQKSVF